MSRPFLAYEVDYLNPDGKKRTVGLHARDSFQARCLCIELVGRDHIKEILRPRLVPEFDF